MKSKVFKTALIVFGITLFTTQNSFAQQEGKGDRKEPPTYSELLKKMDENDDGKLSKEEVKGPLKDHFADVDVDEDGFITEEEFEKAPRPKRKKGGK